MTSDRSRLVVTGAHGLIGTVLRERLADQFDIVGIDLQPGPGIAAADIAERSQLVQAFAEIGSFERLVHLAGDRRVEAPWQSVARNNIHGTANVYSTALDHGVRRIVFASSNHISGMYEQEPELAELVTVEDEIRPDSLYGVSKLFGEGLARYYYEVHDMQSVCLRIGSVLADDDPSDSDRYRRTWLSHRDLAQLVLCSLRADVGFGVYFGVSDNRDRIWSIEAAERELGYRPQDDGAQLGSAQD